MPLDEVTIDRMRRAVARLHGLRPQVAEEARRSLYVDERLIREYHGALDLLSAIGYDVTEFRVPDDEIQRQVSSSNYLTGAKTYTETRSATGTLALAKVDAALEYFRLSLKNAE
jgi:hypothetical protein